MASDLIGPEQNRKTFIVPRQTRLQAGTCTKPWWFRIPLTKKLPSQPRHYKFAKVSVPRDPNPLADMDRGSNSRGRGGGSKLLGHRAKLFLRPRWRPFAFFIVLLFVLQTEISGKFVNIYFSCFRHFVV